MSLCPATGLSLSLRHVCELLLPLFPLTRTTKLASFRAVPYPLSRPFPVLLLHLCYLPRDETLFKQDSHIRAEQKLISLRMYDRYSKRALLCRTVSLNYFAFSNRKLTSLYGQHAPPTPY